MGQRRNLHPDAPMWTLVIIEVYEQGYPFTGIINGLETVLAIDNLRLEYTVYTLCNSVVGRLVILRHADHYTIFLQFLRVGVAAVLHASVGVVNEPRQFVGRCLADGHPEGL